MTKSNKTTSIHNQLRREVLEWLGRAPTVEAPEFELLEWFLHETEARHAEMRAAEEHYIADQRATGAPEIASSAEFVGELGFG